MQRSIFSLKTKIFIFLFNTLMLFVVGYFQYKYQEQDLETKFNVQVDAIDKQFSNKIATIKGVITSISSYYKSSPEIDSSSFSTLGKDLLSYYDYIDGLGFATIVNNSEKISFSQDMQDSGFYGFKFKNYDSSANLVESTTVAPRYAPLIFIEPSSYKYTRFYGYDMYNDETFKEAFVKASLSDEVAIKDMVKSKFGDYFHFFIKATYNGHIKEDTDEYRFKNTNGFYIININLNNILLELQEKYAHYNIQVVELNAYEDIKNQTLSEDTLNFKKLEYFKKVDDFERSHLYISKRLKFSDFNFLTFTLTILLIIFMQIIYVYIWRKDTISKNKLRYKATHDSLTNLYSRNYFKENAHIKISNVKRNQKYKAAVLFIDLDMFKEINDSFGHNFGDKVLINISQRISLVMRENDILSRHGGDEFLIFLDGITSNKEIENIVKKIMSCLSKPIYFNTNKISVTVSVGISIFPNDGDSVDNLMKFADSAMFKAKDDGRNTFKFYDKEMTREVLQRVIMENKLKEAIKHDEFVVFYQPQFNGITNEITGLEALVRWQDKERGLVFPNDFIILAENTGLIVALDRLVMKQAMNQFCIWKKEGLKLGRLSLNLSTKQLKSADFIDVLTDMTSKYECLADDIELEVTESGIMEDPTASIKKLEKISALGFKISIDDFGTGYSSLAYLKKLPIDKLKIDKSFIDGLPDNEEDIAIAQSVIALAKSLKMDLIAEGVETIEQKDFLVKNGCHKIQGYYYAKPMRKEDLEIFLKQHSV
ncbi:EAL domain-containing protein [Sulfurimonas sp.]|uniref:bifunctional diguanylate cyclase/phosphodiesterase n=1 Tax=Sulfurimonas sp. TaxID=2022749 RepID=UPI0025E1F3E1|nr:EAL domain-containing protein [Sulfurimonas sp.]